VELAARLGRDREVALFALVIDQQIRIADLGEGIAGFAESGVERVAAFDDLVVVQRIARPDADGLLWHNTRPVATVPRDR